MRVVSRSKLGDALHQAGSFEKSQDAFHEAENLQKKNQPKFPFLYSMRGFQYCDLLLSQGNYVEVERRAQKALEIVLTRYPKIFLTLRLNNLSLGRAKLLRIQQTSEVLEHRSLAGH